MGGMYCCRRGKTDEFLADLAVRWPGVRHMLAVDPHQAAEHVLNLTMALGLQPYKAQVHPDSWDSLLLLCMHWLTYFHAHISAYAHCHWLKSGLVNSAAVMHRTASDINTCNAE